MCGERLLLLLQMSRGSAGFALQLMLRRQHSSRLWSRPQLTSAEWIFLRECAAKGDFSECLNLAQGYAFIRYNLLYVSALSSFSPFGPQGKDCLLPGSFGSLAGHD
jgi:hypothetical protein